MVSSLVIHQLCMGVFCIIFNGNPCKLQRGWTALMSASKNGHANVVEILLQYGASMDMQDEVRTDFILCMEWHVMHLVCGELFI